MKNNKIDLFEYEEDFRIALEKHEDLEIVLSRFPKWLLDYHVGTSGDSQVSDLIEMEGIEELDYDNGKPLKLIEWLNGGYYDMNFLDNQEKIFNDYIDYLNDYINIVDYLVTNTDYTVDPIASDGYINIYDIIHGIDDKVVVGRHLEDSKPYIIEYAEDGQDYFMIDDNKFFINEFLRLNI